MLLTGPVQFPSPFNIYLFSLHLFHALLLPAPMTLVCLEPPLTLSMLNKSPTTALCTALLASPRVLHPESREHSVHPQFLPHLGVLCPPLLLSLYPPSSCSPAFLLLSLLSPSPKFRGTCYFLEELGWGYINGKLPSISAMEQLPPLPNTEHPIIVPRFRTQCYPQRYTCPTHGANTAVWG